MQLCIVWFCGCIIGAVRPGSEQTFLIVACERWINYRRPVRTNRHDACPETRCRQVAFLWREHWPSHGEPEHRVRRGRQVKFTRWAGGPTRWTDTSTPTHTGWKNPRLEQWSPQTNGSHAAYKETVKKMFSHCCPASAGPLHQRGHCIICV